MTRAMFSASFAASLIVVLPPSLFSHTRFIGQFGYRQEDIVMLTDDAQNPRQVPTKQNMVSFLKSR